MTDKVEQIRQEIERRYNISRIGAHSAFRNGKCEALREVLDFIDSMPDKPKFKVGDTIRYRWAEKGELEEEVYEHLWKGRMGTDVSKPIYFSYDELLEVARHFANWQKQQMMKDAKSGTVQKDYQVILDDGAYIDLDPSMQLKPSFAVKEGERVKLIIVRE